MQNTPATQPTGRYIVIEGLSPHKSQIVQLLAERLQTAHVPVTVNTHTSPYAGLTTELISQIIANPKYTRSPRTEVLLTNALQAQYLHDVHAVTQQGGVYIADTNFLSQLALQYYGFGLEQDYAKLQELIVYALGGNQPDITVVLDTPANALSDLYRQQLLQGYSAPDHGAFLERVRAGYLWEARQRQLPVVYASSDITELTEQLWPYVADLAKTHAQPSGSGMSSVADVLAKRSEKSEKAAAVTPEPTVVAEPAGPVVESRGISFAALAPLQAVGPATELPTAFESTDKRGRFCYDIPPALKGTVRSRYIKGINQLFQHYTQLHTELTAWNAANSDSGVSAQDITDALRSVLPLAAQTTIAGSGKTLPKPNAPSASISDLTKLAVDLLPPNFAPVTQPVTLVSATPRNELDAAAAMLFSASDVPLRDIVQAISEAPYQRKVDILQAAMQGGAPSALSTVHYTFDIVTSYDVLLHAQRHFSAIQWQAPTPRLGYATPACIEEAGLSDLYDTCYDTSLSLHSYLQAEGQGDYAHYGALLGHKVRWTVDCTLQAVHMAVQSDVPQVKSLANTILETIAETHPLLIESLQRTSIAS